MHRCAIAGFTTATVLALTIAAPGVKAGSRVSASAVVTFPPGSSTGTVSLSASHEATVTALDDVDKGRPWGLGGDLWECGFLSSTHKDGCSASGKVFKEGDTISCSTSATGHCSASFMARTEAQIILPFFDPAGAGDTDQTGCQSTACQTVVDEGGPDDQICDTCTSPIVIDLGGRGFRFTGLDAPVSFDIDADGRQETISWTDPTAEMAFLVYDFNGDGDIATGYELFGSVTGQRPSDDPNGFRALANLESAKNGGNEDGVMSAEDKFFQYLELWVDRNHDGVSQPSELSPLSWHVVAISLEPVVSERRDRHGNRCRWATMVKFEDHQRLAACDVIFLAGE